MGSSPPFITDLYLVTASFPDMTVVDGTIGGHDGNIWESKGLFGGRGKRLLAYACNHSDEFVVTDIALQPDDDDKGFDDYAIVPITKDTREKALRKHNLYFKKDSRKTASKAVEQVMLINQSKGELLPPHYTAVANTVNELLIIFKLTDVPKQQAAPKPEQEAVAFRPTTALPAVGIDGVPFQINPKYDSSRSGADPVVGGITVIALDDLLRKYEYDFANEEKVLEENS